MVVPAVASMRLCRLGVGNLEHVGGSARVLIFLDYSK